MNPAVRRAFGCLLIFSLGFIFAACSQEGEVEVQNLTGGDLETVVDGVGHYLYPDEAVIQEIKIGRKFIFGPDDTDIGVSGEGECKFYFYNIVGVEDDYTSIFRVYGDAGYLVFWNETGETMDFYLAACSDEYWPEYPDDVVPPGDYTEWKVSDGCWDVLVETQSYYGEVYDIWVDVCEDEIWEFVPPAAAALAEGSSAKVVRAVPGSAPLGMKSRPAASRAAAGPEGASAASGTDKIMKKMKVERRPGRSR